VIHVSLLSDNKSMHKSVLIIVLLELFTAHLLSAQDIPTDTLTVVVHDIYSQGAIEGANVTLYRYGHVIENGYTDPAGRVQFIVDISATGIDEIPSNRISLLPAYPNPLFDHTSVPFSIDTFSRITATMHDLLGRQVASFQSDLVGGSYELKASLSDRAPGIYFLRLLSENDLLGTSVLTKTGASLSSEPASLSIQHTMTETPYSNSGAGKTLSSSGVAYELEVTKEGYEMCTSYLFMPESDEITVRLLTGETNTLGMEFIRVPAGVFDMGDLTGQNERNERPAHSVTLSRDFFVGKYEITQELYESVIGDNPSYYSGQDNLPVEQLSWYEAVRFTNALSVQEGLAPCYDDDGVVIGAENNPYVCEGYRLLMEAEWEYAARAGTTTRYSFGDDAGDIVNFAWYAAPRTHPVGEKQPNPWGLYDVHGNVWEWVYDLYGSRYYEESPSIDPVGPTTTQGMWRVYRVLRGGGCNDPADPRSSIRYNQRPGEGFQCYGFRIARTAD